jgi:flagellin-like hook-associated protein FlgL
MFSIIGIVVVFGAIVAGYLMEHGNLKVLLQPAELIIILGAAIGTVLIANPLHILTKMGGGLVGAFGGSPFNKQRYDGNTNVNSIEISPGRTVSINLPGSQIFANPSGNVLGALNGLITALQNNSGIPAANANLSQSFSELTTQRVFYGNALNEFQSAQTFLSSDKTQLAQEENSLVGADLSASITNFQQATVATNAILNATNQILTTLNLLDYLK